MRCLVVPVTLRLDRLHLTLQAAFGWTNSHLFEFLAGEGRWGVPDPDGDFGPQPIDARKARLSDIVQETGAKTIHYLYDFGDLLEAIGRCPPEDVGGASGYADYLSAIGDPNHPSTKICASGGPNSSIPTSSIGGHSRPPSTHCRESRASIARREGTGSGSGNPMLAWPRPPR
ncbi:plasmid pRiA4b ORF-3 family protein [Bradyrhizobium sp. WSM2793]|uniref:plasmid pRiA4b ORF-3 family protein n=1 Tax=Bradyrhizobium sp. WSM2793 TaxID=1038866 RepID=UPI001FD96247|nr:plasmid pRiA4b ORF-3 family protein [Bradyrhizobium sp. WSM2793]